MVTVPHGFAKVKQVGPHGSDLGRGRTGRTSAQAQASACGSAVERANIPILLSKRTCVYGLTCKVYFKDMKGI